MDRNHLMSFTETAKYLGFSKATLSRRVQKKELVPMTDGYRYYFMKTDVERYLAELVKEVHIATDDDIRAISDRQKEDCFKVEEEENTLAFEDMAWMLKDIRRAMSACKVEDISICGLEIHLKE